MTLLCEGGVWILLAFLLEIYNGLLSLNATTHPSSISLDESLAQPVCLEAL
jgi:hypothetical protein